MAKAGVKSAKLPKGAKAGKPLRGAKLGKGGKPVEFEKVHKAPKKKYSNLIEKKAKGVKLSPHEKKRLVKQEDKIAQKDKLKKLVKVHLDKFDSQWNNNDDDTRDSLCSESSFGSQLPNREPKKRVSFASNIERTKVFDKNVKDLDIKPSDAEPGRGILRSKKEKAAKKASKKAAVAVKSDGKPVNTETPSTTSVTATTTTTTAEAAPALSYTTITGAPSSTGSEELVEFPKKRKIIQVTKKVKEQLLGMDRKERKAFLRQIKAEKNPFAEKALEAKVLWEKIRSGKTSAMEKDDAVNLLVGIVKGNAAKLIYAHDTSRVIECLIALRRPGITNMLFDELTPELVRMAKSKYAKFFVVRMLKYGNAQQRNIIVDAFRGHAVSLMRIVHAAEVLEIVYNEHANVQQRYDIVSEFYGKEFVVFRSDRPRTLSEIIEEEPSKKKLIIQHMEELLQVWVEKTTLRLSLTHRLLLDFLKHCDNDQMINMIDSLKDKVPEIIHTPEGSYVAMKVVWNSNSKDRKLIVKNFKGLSVKAALEKYGNRVFKAIFDCVDDTVLINKYIVSEIGNEIAKVLDDKWGELIVSYIVCPRNTRSLDKKEIQRLQEGDSNPHSKKDKRDRYAEIFNGIQESLYTYIAANLEKMIFEGQQKNFLVFCFQTPSEYDLFTRTIKPELRSNCYKAMLELCKQEFVPMDTERFHIIEHSSGHFIVCSVLRFDQDLPEEEKFATMLLNEKEVDLGSWVSCNRGCYVLNRLATSGAAGAKEKLLKTLNVKKLKEYTFPGAVVLRTTLGL